MTAREEDLAGASGASDELVDVVVIGGSQAGLAMAWHLARQDLGSWYWRRAPSPGTSGAHAGIPSACPGSTAAARPCSVSSTKTPPTSARRSHHAR